MVRYYYNVFKFGSINDKIVKYVMKPTMNIFMFIC